MRRHKHDWGKKDKIRKRKNLLVIGRDGGEREKLEFEHLKRNKKRRGASSEKSELEEVGRKKRRENWRKLRGHRQCRNRRRMRRRRVQPRICVPPFSLILFLWRTTVKCLQSPRQVQCRLTIKAIHQNSELTFSLPQHAIIILLK